MLEVAVLAPNSVGVAASSWLGCVKRVPNPPKLGKVAVLPSFVALLSPKPVKPLAVIDADGVLALSGWVESKEVGLKEGAAADSLADGVAPRAKD